MDTPVPETAPQAPQKRGPGRPPGAGDRRRRRYKTRYRTLSMKQEAACRVYVETNSQLEAYKRVYLTCQNPKMPDEKLWPKANKVFCRPQVNARVTELLDESAKAACLTRSKLVLELGKIAFAELHSGGLIKVSHKLAALAQLSKMVPGAEAPQLLEVEHKGDPVASAAIDIGLLAGLVGYEREKAGQAAEGQAADEVH